MHVTHAFQRQGHYLCEQHVPSSPLNMLPFSISISLLFHGPLHHLSQIYLQRCSVASLWPCQRMEKRQGIITCHLTDNGIPWSFHSFTFQGFVYKTTVRPVLCTFSSCIRGFSACCSGNVSFISVQGKHGGGWGVIILMFMSSESSFFLFTAPPHGSPTAYLP